MRDFIIRKTISCVLLFLPTEILIISNLYISRSVLLINLLIQFLFFIFISIIEKEEIDRIRKEVNSFIDKKNIDKSSLSVLNPASHFYELSIEIKRIGDQLISKQEELYAINIEKDFILDMIFDPIFFINEDSTIIKANRSGSELLKNSASDIKDGLNIRDIVKSRVNEVSIKINGSIKSYQITYINTSENLQKLKRTNSLVMMNDITKYKAYEDSMRDFIANASHEIKTPLAGIIGLLETIKETINNKEDIKTTKRFLEIACNEGEKLVELLQALLSLSRIDFEKENLPTDKVDLSLVISESLRQCIILAKKKNINISLYEKSRLEKKYINGDFTALVRLFNNIICNAIKHSYPGTGIILNIEFCKKCVYVSIQDFGEGIDREKLSRIFEKFYKAGNSRSQGFGLGLSIVKGIAERHRAHIKVESSIGQGTKFFVTFRYNFLK